MHKGCFTKLITCDGIGSIQTEWIWLICRDRIRLIQTGLIDLLRHDQIYSNLFVWSAELGSNDLDGFDGNSDMGGIRLIQMDLAEILRGDCNKSKWFDWSAEMESDWFRLNWLICWDGIRLIQTDLIEICRDGIRLIQTDLIDLLRWDQMDSDWFGLRWDQSG